MLNIPKAQRDPFMVPDPLCSLVTFILGGFQIGVLHDALRRRALGSMQTLLSQRQSRKPEPGLASLESFVGEWPVNILIPSVGNKHNKTLIFFSYFSCP